MSEILVYTTDTQQEYVSLLEFCKRQAERINGRIMFSSGPGKTESFHSCIAGNSSVCDILCHKYNFSCRRATNEKGLLFFTTQYKRLMFEKMVSLLEE